MKKIISCLFFLSLYASAQNSYIEAGDKFYNNRSYLEAIPNYEEALRKDSSNNDLLAKLAECYRLTDNLKGQNLCYGKLVSNGSATDDQKIRYGKVLIEIGSYNAAKVILGNYSNDTAKFHLKRLSKLEKMNRNSNAYVLSPAPYNSQADDFSALIFADNVVFSSSRGKLITKKDDGTHKLYVNTYATSRKANGDFYKPQEFLDGMDTRFNDGPICITQDCTIVFFTRNSSGKQHKATDGTYKLRIFQAFIIGNSIFEPQNITINSDNYNTGYPAISSDGTILYFASDMPGGYGGMDLYYSVMSPDSTWGTAINLGDKINTPHNEMFPFINRDSVFYFASDGHEGFGGFDVYETKLRDLRPTRVYNMGRPVNSEYDDFAYYTSGDLNTFPLNGFVCSNRKDEDADDDIYNMQVLRKVTRGKNVTFIVKDKSKGDLLSNVKLQINGDTGTTNDKGEFAYLIEDDIEYKISANKEKYFNYTDSLNSKSSDLDEFTRTILLEKDPNLSFLAFVTDAKTNEGLADVKIRIKDLFTKQVFDSSLTSPVGEYRKSLAGRKIGDKLAYEITLEKKGYVTNVLNYTAEIKKEGEIKLHEELKMTLGKALVGVDLAKIIDLRPIYFDLGKSKIRPDAAIELDKVVKIMNEYPNMYIELGAHTDCRGVAGANKKLSDARAKASAAYIVNKGKFKKDRIIGKGYGELKLLNACACEGKVQPKCSEEEHSVNRRTEFIVTKMK